MSCAGHEDIALRTRVARGLALLRERLDRRYGARAKWCLVALGGAGKLAAAAGVPGAILMSLKTKVVAAGVICLVAGGLAWRGTVRNGKEGGASSRLEAAGLDSGGTTAPAAEPALPAVEPPEAPATIRSVPFRGPARKGAVVRGRLLDARSDAPVAGAEVDAEAWQRDDTRSKERARTDAGGRFEIVLPAGIRDPILEIRHRDFAPLEAGGKEMRPPPSDFGPFDFGDIRIERGASVRGRVVRAADRSPAGGASLRVVRAGYTGSGIELLSARESGVSAPDGSFELVERVAPLALGGATLFALATDGIGWTTLRVVRGRDTLDDVEIVLESGGGLDVEVVDGSGNSMSGVNLVAVPRFPPLGPEGRSGNLIRTGTGGDPRFMAVTGADGRVAFRGLPFGRPEERSHRPSEYDVVAETTTFKTASVRAVLDRNAVATVRIVLSPAVAAVLAGRVVDVSGAGIAGASVKRSGRALGVTSAEDGTYRLEDVPAAEGRDWFVVRASGFAFFHGEVQLPGGTAEIAHDFRLERSMPVSGRVLDEDGAPVAGIHVDLLRQDGDKIRSVAPDGAKVGADGSFVFSDAAEGPWRLRVLPPQRLRSQWHVPREREVRGGDTGIEVVLRRNPPGRARLVAVIVAAGSGEPLDPIEASVRRDATTFAGDVHEAHEPARSVGRVVVEALRPGRWTLEVRVRDGRRAVSPFEVGADDTEIELRMEFGAPVAIAGRVEFPAGSPVPPPRSAMILPDPHGSATWDRRGGIYERWVGNAAHVDAATGWTFRFEDVVPGRPIRLHLAASDAWFGEAEVRAQSVSGEREVVLRAIPAARVTWTKADDRGAGGIVLSVADADGGWRRIEEVVWEAGKPWSWTSPLPAGTHRWKAERFDLDVPAAQRRPVAVAEGSFEVRAGDVREARIAFRP